MAAAEAPPADRPPLGDRAEPRTDAGDVGAPGRPGISWRALVLLGLVVFGWCAVAVPARAAYGARTTADEPQYLLSALSLAEDHDLDIRDELREERYRDFHEANLLQQTKVLPGGTRVSPHDPLLPVLLAVPVALGGWVGAKLLLAALAGVLAALLAWVAVHRFGVRAKVAVPVVLCFAAVPPLSAYGTQVYPELPAALLVTVVVAGATGVRRAGWVAALLALAALPWLSSKYAPVVVALAVCLTLPLLRARRWRAIGALGAVLAVDALAFVALHQLVYHGFTAYAAGDHFNGGELTVMGESVDYGGRAVRLIGLVVDRGFGLAAWAPAFLLAVPALAALLRRRPPHWVLLVLPLAAGWFTATFLALTMQGWWWPGRQIVLVVPLLVLAVAWFVDALPTATGRRVAGTALAVATAYGVVTWGWLLADVLTARRTLVVDFLQTGAPTYGVWRHLLPDGMAQGPADVAGFVGWTALFAVLAIVGWLAVAPGGAGPVLGSGSAPSSSPLPSPSPSSEARPEPLQSSELQTNMRGESNG